MGWLRHAFAVQSECSASLTPAEEELVERFCQAVVRRRLTAVALVALETLRPLSGLAGQSLYFFSPLASLFVHSAEIERLAAFLQRPDALRILCQRLESLETGSFESKEVPDSSSESRG